MRRSRRENGKRQARRRRRYASLPLRPRLVATFGLVVMVSSVTVSATSYVLVRRARLSAEIREAVHQSRFNLQMASNSLPADPADSEINKLTATLGRRGGFDSVVLHAGRTYQTSSISETSIPHVLREPVARGRVALLASRVAEEPYLVVGGRSLPDGPSFFFYYPLAAVSHDLAILRSVLIGASAALALLSGLVGLAAARGLLLPIRRAGNAARHLQGGALETRLPVEGSDELAGLARSFNEMAEELERKVGELRSLESSHRRFVSDVSHELRTPLTAMTTCADLLEGDTASLDAQGQRVAGMLIQEVRRLGVLIEDLMEISRLDAGVASICWEPVDVGEIIRAAMAARSRPGEVVMHLRGDLNTFADPRRLDAVMGNLLINALQHGAPPVSVTVSGEVDLVLIEVADGGPGIPPEHLPYVFDRFYKADSSRPRSRGSGLGLAIARENVLLHGGDITAESRAGRTLFRVTIPRRRGPSDAAQAQDGRLAGPMQADQPVAEPLPGEESTVTRRAENLSDTSEGMS